MASESEIHRALRQIQSIKKLVRKRCGILMQGNINENVYRIPGIIFSDKTYNDSRWYYKTGTPAWEEDGDHCGDSYDRYWMLGTGKEGRR